MPVSKSTPSNKSSVENETTNKTYMPFKIGTVVNNVPIWLEAQIPYSPNVEEMLYICNMITGIFDDAVKLLERYLLNLRTIEPS